MLMEWSIVFAEFTLVILLSVVTLTVQVVIFRKKSLMTIWKQCGVLSLVVGSITLLAIQNIILSSQWILILLGIITNVPENTFSIVFVAHLSVVLWQFHHCAKVGLFSQRVYFLLFPAKSVKTFNYLLLGVLCIVYVMGFVATAYSFLHYNIPNGKPVPEGCFSFNCMTAKDGNVRFWYSIFIVCITLAITILGSYMLYLLHKHKKRTYSVVEKKTNTFALYVFYVRFICVTVPFFADILLSKIANVDLGKHIGPFATYGSTVDYTVKVIVYYTLAARHKKISSYVKYYIYAGGDQRDNRSTTMQKLAAVSCHITQHRYATHRFLRHLRHLRQLLGVLMDFLDNYNGNMYLRSTTRHYRLSCAACRLNREQHDRDCGFL
ncbi:hypothetical protein QR680_016107 [Steinernema hermaphroditum]|uniref:Uncharacterized protein n=1 Tax=Steinernema hermaphroditum TaxID=289476 RepID=A0AA39LM18_9BILA|nr:hypothetical protein QR680_016107 [Steinernema hermaphroditum]